MFICDIYFHMYGIQFMCLHLKNVHYAYRYSHHIERVDIEQNWLLHLAVSIFAFIYIYINATLRNTIQIKRKE